MKLTEYEGKELFRAAGIRTPAFAVVNRDTDADTLSFPLMLKSQVLSGDRKKKGGIAEVRTREEFNDAKDRLFQLPIDGMLPEYLLAEELIQTEQEWYVSFSYAGSVRGPVLTLSSSGGSGIRHAVTLPVNILAGVDDAFAHDALTHAGMPSSAPLVETICSLWNLFCKEKLFLVEINPLFIQSDGSVIAGDAKVIRDDALLPPGEKPVIPLGGDIAVIASGGGASMLNIDILMRAGGKPANYVEYSGNPPASVVEDLTVRVLTNPDIRGAWVVGGTANFTDLYETLRGFADGLAKVVPKPSYPIVIRRDGPRQKEAKEMLESFGKTNDFELYVFGPETSMAESATFLLERMKDHEHTD